MLTLFNEVIKLFKLLLVPFRLFYWSLKLLYGVLYITAWHIYGVFRPFVLIGVHLLKGERQKAIDVFKQYLGAILVVFFLIMSIGIALAWIVTQLPWTWAAYMLGGI